MASSHGFIWPESGPVEAPDWAPTLDCGAGLHGLLWGAGDGQLLNWSPDAKWLVVEVCEYVDLNGKIKFPSGMVLFSGDRQGAIDFLTPKAPAGTSITGGTATAGYGGTATAGYGGTATAGVRGTATAGYGGTATAGEGGTLIVRWYDYARSRYRVATAEIGEDGIEPNVPYRYDPDSKSWTKAN